MKHSTAEAEKPQLNTTEADLAEVDSVPAANTNASDEAVPGMIGITWLPAVNITKGKVRKHTWADFVAAIREGVKTVEAPSKRKLPLFAPYAKADSMRDGNGLTHLNVAVLDWDALPPDTYSELVREVQKLDFQVMLYTSPSDGTSQCGRGCRREAEQDKDGKIKKQPVEQGPCGTPCNLCGEPFPAIRKCRLIFGLDKPMPIEFLEPFQAFWSKTLAGVAIDECPAAQAYYYGHVAGTPEREFYARSGDQLCWSAMGLVAPAPIVLAPGTITATAGRFDLEDVLAKVKLLAPLYAEDVERNDGRLYVSGWCRCALGIEEPAAHEQIVETLMGEHYYPGHASAMLRAFRKGPEGYAANGQLAPGLNAVAEWAAEADPKGGTTEEWTERLRVPSQPRPWADRARAAGERTLDRALVKVREEVLAGERKPTGPDSPIDWRPINGSNDFDKMLGGITKSGAHHLLSCTVDPGGIVWTPCGCPVYQSSEVSKINKLFLDLHYPGNTLRLLLGEFYVWRNGVFKRTPDRWIHAELNDFLLRAQVLKMQDENGNVGLRKVSGISTRKLNELVADLKRSKGLLLPDETEEGTWLCNARPGRWAAVQGALINPDTSEVIEPTPDFWTTNTLSVAYDPQAKCPRWQQYVQEIYPDDEEAQLGLQEGFGYLVFGTNRLQKMLIWRGKAGTGKGVAADDVLGGLMGDSYGVTSVRNLSNPFGLAAWPGKQCMVFGDERNAQARHTDLGEVTGRLLKIVGCTPIEVTRKNVDTVKHTLSARILLVANDTPFIADASGAIDDRLAFLRQTKVKFRGTDRQDMGLRDKLAKELPGILLWALEGWQRLLKERNGRFRELEPELRAEMRNKGCTIREFVEDNFLLDPNEEVTLDEVWSLADTWYQDSNIRRPSKTKFREELKQAYEDKLSVKRDSDPKRTWKVKGLRRESIGPGAAPGARPAFMTN